MKNIGMIVAVEMDSLLSYYGKAGETVTKHGFKIHTYEFKDYKLYAVNSGVGENAAAAATQMLISDFDVKMIINFGVVGGLTEDMTEEKLCIVDKVVHYMFDLSGIDNVKKAQYPPYDDIYIPVNNSLFSQFFSKHNDIKHVICASGDKFVETEEEKRSLNREFGAEICEMEAAGIVITANRCNIPTVLIKAVSDGLCGGSKSFKEELTKASDICVKLTAELIEELNI